MTLFSAVAGFAARGSQVFEKVEEVLANKLVKRDDRFALPVIKKGKGKQTRKIR